IRTRVAVRERAATLSFEATIKLHPRIEETALRTFMVCSRIPILLRSSRGRQKKPPESAVFCGFSLERAKGFEPSTPTLARLCSTPELRPRSEGAHHTGRKPDCKCAARREMRGPRGPVKPRPGGLPDALRHRSRGLRTAPCPLHLRNFSPA